MIGKIIVAIMIIFGILLVLGALSSPKYDSALAEKNMAILTNELRLVHRIQPDLNRVWVDGYVWRVLHAEHKEIAAKNIAYYMGYKVGCMRAEIYDRQSGRMLAEYSGISGFSVK